MFTQKFLPFILLSLLLACTPQKNTLTINHTNPQIQYSGRIDTSSTKGAELFWSGTSIKFNFEGQTISALIEDEKGDNYYNVIIDNNDPFIFRPDTAKRYHQLASDLAAGEHSLEIFKRTEWDRGKSIFYGFQIGGNAKILPKSSTKKEK